MLKVDGSVWGALDVHVIVLAPVPVKAGDVIVIVACASEASARTAADSFAIENMFLRMGRCLRRGN